MFVLCPKCHNHYDDSTHSNECHGLGRTVSKPTAAGSAHREIRSAPIVDHVNALKAARRQAADRMATEGVG